MTVKVVYFSRSGNSKRVAAKINDKLDGRMVEIRDQMNWKGILGFIKAGYYTTQNKYFPIQVNGKLNANDVLVVVTPLWAGGPAQAVRIFLKDRTLAKVHLVITSNGSTVKKLDQREEYASISDIVKNQKNEDAVIKALLGTIKGKK